ncbi:MAG: hypothetical protein JO168_01465 [Solirubrobacterales bacterium]|nr:hypothetical protein [Solirubrobacterales bacterium]
MGRARLVREQPREVNPLGSEDFRPYPLRRDAARRKSRRNFVHERHGTADIEVRLGGDDVVEVSAGQAPVDVEVLAGAVIGAG